MTLQQIRYMITIAETGSLGKAAEKLYVSQPSLTSAVKEMEKELGMTLFHRGSRGVTLTTDGLRLLPYARQVEGQYLNLMEAFGKIEKRKTHFAVSTQHYSFAVKAFVQMAQQVDVAEYELAIRETRTQEVISDVAGMRSEIGVLYMNESNRKPLMKLLDQEGLVFRPMIVCSAYVYLWKKHPLAKRKELTLEDLHPYPCLAFEQGDAPFYFSEELMSTEQYPRLIHCCDRATVLNLMVGLKGYTLCSGIICEELSGMDYVAIPLRIGENPDEAAMEIGYIERKNSIRSSLAEQYIREMQKYLGTEGGGAAPETGAKQEKQRRT
ncbi:MAG: LysR family transcriptional regulator [Clostridia bacterium]|nr:LysR family transcriptional regulator [Clostridia bacterium]